jgi:hypothetical protein
MLVKLPQLIIIEHEFGKTEFPNWERFLLSFQHLNCFVEDGSRNPNNMGKGDV